jgi:hypothetical protein
MERLGLSGLSLGPSSSFGIWEIVFRRSYGLGLGLGKDVSTTTEDVGEEDNGLGGNPSHPVSLL